MKKISIIFCMFLGLSACGTSDKTTTIPVHKNEGEVVSLTLDEFETKMQNKESFVVLFSQTNCGACMYFFSVSDEYTKEFGLTLYDIKLDEESKPVEEILELIHGHFEDFYSTPTLYIVKDGEMHDTLNGESNPVDLERYKQFLNDNSKIFGK